MRKVLLLLALAASSLVLTVGPSTAASDTTCTGTLIGGPPHDNVVVPPGATCILIGATVLGNVKALEDSRLRVQASNVRGNVLGDKADTVEVAGSIVRENIIIKEGGPATGSVMPPFFSCSGTPCEAAVVNSTVQEGSIQIERMEGSVALNGAGAISPLRGNIKVEDNFVAAPESLSVGNSRVAQNLQVLKNKGSGFEMVSNNTVGENLQVEDNVVAAPGFLTVGLNSVGQNLQVFKNQGPGSKAVFRNTVGESLQCFDNDPPFFATGNVAREAQGQCGATPLP